MLPNVFPGAGATPDYNTVDASLWFIEAWRAYVDATGDEAAPCVASFRCWPRSSTGTSRARATASRVDPADGLLRAGEPGVQLTWMDARVGDRVVTPRIGKPVEINALWYNALVAMAAMARADRRAGGFLSLGGGERRGRGSRVSSGPDGRGLYDVLDGPDGA